MESDSSKYNLQPSASTVAPAAGSMSQASMAAVVLATVLVSAALGLSVYNYSELKDKEDEKTGTGYGRVSAGKNIELTSGTARVNLKDAIAIDEAQIGSIYVTGNNIYGSTGNVTAATLNSGICISSEGLCLHSTTSIDILARGLLGSADENINMTANDNINMDAVDFDLDATGDFFLDAKHKISMSAEDFDLDATNNISMTAANFDLDATSNITMDAVDFDISAASKISVTAINFDLDVSKKIDIDAYNIDLDTTNNITMDAINFDINATTNISMTAGNNIKVGDETFEEGVLLSVGVCTGGVSALAMEVDGNSLFNNGIIEGISLVSVSGSGSSDGFLSFTASDLVSKPNLIYNELSGYNKNIYFPDLADIIDELGAKTPSELNNLLLPDTTIHNNGGFVEVFPGTSTTIYGSCMPASQQARIGMSAPAIARFIIKDQSNAELYIIGSNL